MATAAPVGATVSPCPSAEKKDPKKTTVTFRIYVFFDGTLNNMYNTEERVNDASQPDSAWWDLKASREQSRIREADSSYANDLSNVAILSKYSPEDLTEATLKSFSFYVEGIGTTRGQSDSSAGYALGKGDTGIPTRVTDAVELMVNRIKALGKPQANQDVSIELFAFGFSRGAAAARHFVYQVVKGDKSLSLSKRLTSQGYSVAKVTVKFVGLFDTVSSFGLNTDDDTKDLNLDAVSDAERVVQLAAADEHRQKFALTNIKSCGPGSAKAAEVFLPGVHSDIGGGYSGSEQSDLPVFMTPYSDSGNPKAMAGYDSYTRKLHEEAAARMEKERLWYIEQGWCDKEHAIVQSNALRITRSGLSNLYSRIPLRIMMEFGMKAGVGFNMELVEATPLTAMNQIKTDGGQPLPEYLMAYARAATRSTPGDWHYVSPPSWVLQLRRKFLHVSSWFDFLPHVPQFRSNQGYGTTWPYLLHGKRERRYFDG